MAHERTSPSRPSWNRFQLALVAQLLLSSCAASPGAEPKHTQAPPRSSGPVPAPITVHSLASAAPAPDSAPAPDYAKLAAELEAHLYGEIVDRWFPRAVDTQAGGFGPHFRHDWSKDAKEDRFLVFQSRMTWIAAQTAERSPERRESFRAHALHGLAWLEQRQWDPKFGGFFWEVAKDGKPLTTEKHVYGVAFGIYASAAVSRATGDPRGKALALRAFDWLEAHAHDAKHGGYYEALDRAGNPILVAPAPNRPNDQIGTKYGRKSMNTHLHLLEAFSVLYELTREPRVERRLAEVFALVRDEVCDRRGFLHLYFEPDWTPVAGQDSYGHDVETGYLLLEAAHALGRADDAETHRVARLLVDHALRFGWDDEHGGFYDQGPIEGPAEHTDKIWWTQAEGLNALLLMHELYGRETPDYFAQFERQWRFIERHLVDAKHGEWFERARADGARVNPEAGKGGMWKDPYHQGRALMNSIDRLRRLTRAN